MSFFEEPQFSKSRRKRRGFGAGLLILVFLGLVSVNIFPTPYVIQRPGPTFNVLGESGENPVIKILDTPSYPTTGQLDVTTVSMVGNPRQTPTWLEIIAAWMNPAQIVVPLEKAFPPDQTVEQVEAESEAMMEQSQQEAIAAALSELGYEFETRIYISRVEKGAAASGKLVASDFLLSTNGTALTTIEDLQRSVSSWDEKEPIVVEVLRSGEILNFEIEPVKIDGVFRLGILVGYTYDFPVKIQLDLGDVGGPSGGLIFALGIYDELTPGSLLEGKHVAGTGTISAAGKVGPIGGIRQKLFGAESAGASWFLAPAENCPEVIGHVPDGLQVVKISDLKGAISALEVIGSDGPVEQLPSCSAG